MHRIEVDRKSVVAHYADYSQEPPNVAAYAKKGLNEWEVVPFPFMRMLEKLGECRINLNQQDRRWWRMSKRGNFSVKSYFRMLDPPFAASFARKGIWLNPIHRFSS